MTKHTEQSVAKKYEVRRAASGAGLGLFATQSIKKGEFIIEYFGDVITAKEADERGGKYLFETSSRRVIDGSTRKNIARYINHSCKPNCETEVKKGRVFVYAKRAIKPGEELAYDYGDEYFKDFIEPIGCRCVACEEK